MVERKALLILAIATIAVAYVSEALVHTFETVAKSFGWSELFIGVIIVAIVGNAAEHASAIIMAYKNKVNIAVEIAIGSTLQIAMFVAPVLVLLSMFFTQRMPLVFTIPELVSMITAVFLTIAISNDGDTNWFEGGTLLAAYVIMGIGFIYYEKIGITIVPRENNKQSSIYLYVGRSQTGETSIQHMSFNYGLVYSIIS